MTYGQSVGNEVGEIIDFATYSYSNHSPSYRSLSKQGDAIEVVKGEEVDNENQDAAEIDGLYPGNPIFDSSDSRNSVLDDNEYEYKGMQVQGVKWKRS